MRAAIFYLLFISVLFQGCRFGEQSIVMTVNGPVGSNELGMTLTHEHLLVDFIGADSTGYHRWNRDSVVEKVVPYLEELKQLGFNAFVECTPAYLGRDPLLLKKIVEKTGLHIITNTGYYGARNNIFIPGEVLDQSAEEIAATWIREFDSGIEDTGIRPGFIKIGVDRDETLSAEHSKLIHAAALTHKATGLVIASHTGPDGPAFEQINVIKSHGMDPSAFIWVHAQMGSLDGNIVAAREGAWISLDNINVKRDDNPGSLYSTAWYADRIVALKEAGLLHRVLVSQDAGWYRPGEPGGGEFRGFTDIGRELVPALTARGFSQEEIEQLLIRNPKESFAIR
jgi:phosphotriesterase-related protein